MAVHLKMDFRILEVSGTVHILQCQRGKITCEHGIEYNPKQSGALMRAIHELRGHTCSPMESETASRSPRIAKRPQIVDIRELGGAARLQNGA
jgi:hypothetical protein